MRAARVAAPALAAPALGGGARVRAAAGAPPAAAAVVLFHGCGSHTHVVLGAAVRTLAAALPAAVRARRVGHSSGGRCGSSGMRLSGVACKRQRRSNGTRKLRVLVVAGDSLRNAVSTSGMPAAVTVPAAGGDVAPAVSGNCRVW